MLARRVPLALFGFSLAAGAAAAPTPAPAQGRSVDPDEVVCEKVEVTGSRLAVKRVCMTRAEWADRRQQDRMATEKSQILGPMKDN